MVDAVVIYKSSRKVPVVPPTPARTSLLPHFNTTQMLPSATGLEGGAMGIGFHTSSGPVSKAVVIPLGSNVTVFSAMLQAVTTALASVATTVSDTIPTTLLPLSHVRKCSRILRTSAEAKGCRALRLWIPNKAVAAALLSPLPHATRSRHHRFLADARLCTRVLEANGVEVAVDWIPPSAHPLQTSLSLHKRVRRAATPEPYLASAPSAVVSHSAIFSSALRRIACAIRHHRTSYARLHPNSASQHHLSLITDLLTDKDTERITDRWWLPTTVAFPAASIYRNSRLEEVAVARLRLGCAPFASTYHRLGLPITPHCTVCPGSVHDDVTHRLSHCLRYEPHRSDLQRLVTQAGWSRGSYASFDGALSDTDPDRVGLFMDFLKRSGLLADINRSFALH